MLHTLEEFMFIMGMNDKTLEYLHVYNIFINA